MEEHFSLLQQLKSVSDKIVVWQSDLLQAGKGSPKLTDSNPLCHPFIDVLMTILKHGLIQGKRPVTLWEFFQKLNKASHGDDLAKHTLKMCKNQGTTAEHHALAMVRFGLRDKTFEVFFSQLSHSRFVPLCYTKTAFMANPDAIDALVVIIISVSTVDFDIPLLPPAKGPATPAPRSHRALPTLPTPMAINKAIHTKASRERLPAPAPEQANPLPPITADTLESIQSRCIEVAFLTQEVAAVLETPDLAPRAYGDSYSTAADTPTGTSDTDDYSPSEIGTKTAKVLRALIDEGRLISGSMASSVPPESESDTCESGVSVQADSIFAEDEVVSHADVENDADTESDTDDSGLDVPMHTDTDDSGDDSDSDSVRSGASELLAARAELELEDNSDVGSAHTESTVALSHAPTDLEDHDSTAESGLDVIADPDCECSATPASVRSTQSGPVTQVNPISLATTPTPESAVTTTLATPTALGLGPDEDRMSTASILDSVVESHFGTTVPVRQFPPPLTPKSFRLPKPWLTSLLTQPARETSLEQQGSVCPGCDATIIGKVNKIALQRCYYTGHLYCNDCHDGSMTSAIPWRVVGNWDWTEMPIAVKATSAMELYWDTPMMSTEDELAAVYSSNKLLQKAVSLRQTLALMVPFVLTCPGRDELLRDIPESRQHYMGPPHMWSMADLTDLKFNDLLGWLQRLVEMYYVHITVNCPNCQGRGFFCEMCRGKDTLFPFQAKIHRCNVCKAIFHQACWKKHGKKCPRCARWGDRS
ncbi:protein of unknown function (DUF4206) [Carpediemonas membranifera]|uniref:RUN domain-containing protein n=1 Tax=Carpediemonas membranifera TaxID=201153 RepID=A0A8J6E131_9EUKA|nr:protein of unknown function (DUF4206) [Carpediemonas membranifera]|eukprot:KAG9390112.1 protein of unknown function (DUF4206) [Carpediemonas membranifera]